MKYAIPDAGPPFAAIGSVPVIVMGNMRLAPVAARGVMVADGGRRVDQPGRLERPEAGDSVYLEIGGIHSECVKPLSLGQPAETANRVGPPSCPARDSATRYR